MYTALKGKGRPGGSQYQQNKRRSSKQETTATTSSCQTFNNLFLLYCRYTVTMMIFALGGFVYFLENILLAWAMLQCPYISKTLSSPPPQNKNDWVHSVIFEPQPKMQDHPIK